MRWIVQVEVFSEDLAHCLGLDVGLDVDAGGCGDGGTGEDVDGHHGVEIKLWVR